MLCTTIAFVVVVAVAVTVIVVVAHIAVIAWENGTGDWHLGLGAPGEPLRG